MINVFISVPMRGRSSEAIEYSIRKMKNIARAYLADNDIERKNINFLNTKVLETPPQEADQRIWYLGAAVQKLADADYLIIPDGLDYKMYPGCAMEGQVFTAYRGLDKVIPVRYEYIFTDTELEAMQINQPIIHQCGNPECDCIKPEDC